MESPEFRIRSCLVCTVMSGPRCHPEGHERRFMAPFCQQVSLQPVYNNNSTLQCAKIVMHSEPNNALYKEDQEANTFRLISAHWEKCAAAEGLLSMAHLPTYFANQHLKNPGGRASSRSESWVDLLLSLDAFMCQDDYGLQHKHKHPCEHCNAHNAPSCPGHTGRDYLAWRAATLSPAVSDKQALPLIPKTWHTASLIILCFSGVGSHSLVKRKKE